MKIKALGIYILMILFISGCNSNKKTGGESIEERMAEDMKVTYMNSIEVKDSWSKYGVGDPFVMRFDGKYYLYASTKDGEVGIMAWSSDDLIHWTHEGMVAEENITISAYAPEVLYFNGVFYMTTSPAGRGHYILTSESPTGPFVARTDNFGCWIDGSFFIDDDGKRYFTNASPTGIEGHLMKDPLTVGPGMVLNAYLGHWTEGPMIIKRNGLYFLTYTGNHLDSAGYRINYAVSSEGPLGSYTIPDNNPLIINTSEDFRGLGHSSTVMGPDLDSYYFVYHNSTYDQGPRVRYMNIDRLVFNGSKMDALGPTHFIQPAPAQPDFSTRYDSNSEDMLLGEFNENKVLLSKSATENHFTAEYNWIESEKINEEGTQLIFGYEDENNYSMVQFNYTQNLGEIFNIHKGTKEKIGTFQLYKDYNHTKLHTVRIEKYNEAVDVYIDQLNLFTGESAGMKAGKIGYIWKDNQPSIGYTAFSNEVKGSSDYNALKPIPGSIEAVHYSESNFEREEATLLKKDGSYYIQLTRKSDKVTYSINVESSGNYKVGLNAELDNQDNRVKLYLDGSEISSVNIPVSEGGNKEWRKVVSNVLKLEEGIHQLTISLEKKNPLSLSTIEMVKVNDKPISIYYPLVEGTLKGAQYMGQWLSWKMSNKGLKAIDISDEKIMFGETDWTDYVMDVEVMYDGEGGLENAGILFRSSQESYHKDQVDTAAISYYLKIGENQLELSKFNYDKTVIKTANFKLSPNQYTHIRIAVQGDLIQIYAGDMEEAILTYKDPQAYIAGRIGFWSQNSSLYFKELKVQ